MSWLTLQGFAWNDYDDEVSVAFRALIAGDVAGFLGQVPAYGGSLVLRAPFAGATAALGGGELAVYRAVSIPCLLAARGLRASSSCAAWTQRGRSSGVARARARAVRLQPDHAAGAGDRPPRGAAGRGAGDRRGARRGRPAHDPRRAPARPGDRHEVLGGPRDRPGAARAAGAPLLALGLAGGVTRSPSSRRSRSPARTTRSSPARARPAASSSSPGRPGGFSARAATSSSAAAACPSPAATASRRSGCRR